MVARSCAKDNSSRCIGFVRVKVEVYAYCADADQP
jgi:hypothetical protein